MQSFLRVCDALVHVFFLFVALVVIGAISAASHEDGATVSSTTAYLATFGLIASFWCVSVLYRFATFPLRSRAVADVAAKRVKSGVTTSAEADAVVQRWNAHKWRAILLARGFPKWP